MTFGGLCVNICRLFFFLSMFGALSPVVAELAQPASKFLVAEVESEILPVESAFQMFVAKNNDAIEIRWLIAPGCYLYRDKLTFSIDIDESDIPEGVLFHDEFFGEVEVYFDQLVVNMSTKSKKVLLKELIVGFQGCSESGFCYPAQKREISL